MSGPRAYLLGVVVVLLAGGVASVLAGLLVAASMSDLACTSGLRDALLGETRHPERFTWSRFRSLRPGTTGADVTRSLGEPLGRYEAPDGGSAWYFGEANPGQSGYCIANVRLGPDGRVESLFAAYED